MYCRAGYEAGIRSAILQMSFADSKTAGVPRFNVTAKDDVRRLLSVELLHGGGIFNLHFLLAFVVGILVILVTSGLGMSERRREIGILKATGWQTDEILLRGVVESLLLSFTGAAIALLLVFVWLNWLNGCWIAAVFLAGVDAATTFKIPCSLAPVPALICFLISLIIVLSGTLYSCWRAAIVPPVEAMR